jgi:hypothetical protein
MTRFKKNIHFTFPCDCAPNNHLHRAEPFLRCWQCAQILTTFPATYGSRRVITVFTRARHIWVPTLSHMKAIHVSNALFLRSIQYYHSVYSYFFRLICFSSGSLTKVLLPLISPLPYALYMPLTTHSPSFDLQRDMSWRKYTIEFLNVL